jgi:hypothetical protein
MEKFLKFPIAGSTYQLVSVKGVVLVSQATATTTTIQYVGTTEILTITHDTVANDDFRDFVQNQIASALTTSWTNPVFTVTPPVEVTSITLA